MAELEFNLKANFDQISEARKELNRLREELKRTTKETDPAVVQDLTDRYTEQKNKIGDLSSAMSRYATVMSSNFSKKMQSLTREVYSFELQADSSRRKIEKISSEIAKMESQMRKGGLDAGTSAIYSDNISNGYAQLNDEKARLESLTGLGKQARQELQNMQAEYARYSGSVTPAKDVTNQMTAAFSSMIAEMKKVPTVGEGATSLFNRLSGDAKQLAMSLVGGLGFEQLAEHIFSVRSQFQQLEISFNTMLGSEQQAGALMSQLIDTAAKTPFDMGSITQGAKQLLAYGTAANEVNDILTHLGDISAGLSIPLGDLVYLYGTTMSQGRMYTMDLRQFMGRGIPMAEELGKIMGKTTQEVQQAVTDGKVGADLVKKAIVNMTEEGGKFGGLMEKQSKTLQGQWSNIGDSVDQMFNELGKKSESVFGTGLEFISTLVENWETVVKVIGTAAVAVGTYKACLMAAASIQKAQNQATLDGIASTLDEQIKAYKDQAELYHSYNEKDTSEYKNKRLWDLNESVGNTDLIGNEKAEELVSLKIKEAEADGIITKEMSEQLQLKRDMLVAQQQSAVKEQQEVVELSKGLDEKMAQYKEMENDYRHLNGKDTKDYKANRYNELSNALSDTENIGDDNTEERISKQIELAKSEGLISEEMAKQLQLKRDLLIEQSRIAEKEQMQWQNSVNAKEQAEEELRQKQADEAEISRLNALAEQKKAEEKLEKEISDANKTKYGQALLETNELEKQVSLLEESKDAAYDDARQKKIAVDELDNQIKKQQELVDLQEKNIVESNGMGDTSSFGGYEDAFSDTENASIAEYEAEKAKLDELIQKRQQANDEFEQAHEKARAINQEKIDTEERLAEAQENEIEIYKETGAAADEIQDKVEQGIAIKEGDTTITEAVTTANQVNTSSENANTASKNANAGATARQTTANVANTASETANSTATNANTASENINTSAKQRNSLVTAFLSVGNKGLTLAQNVLTWAINSTTASMRALWAAMLANPLTTIITLVTTAISVFSMFGDEEEDAAQKTEDMGNKAAEASNKVRSLFSVLKQGDPESHKDTINELKSAYEEYGVKLDETKMKSKDMGVQLDELKSHEEELIGLIEKRSVEMERANQLQQAYSDYNTANDKTYSSFKDETDGQLSDIERGTIRSLISQDDLDKMAQLSAGMKECGGDLKVYNALSVEYSKVQAGVNAKIDAYLEGLGHSRDEVEDVIADISKYTDGLVENKVQLDGSINAVNNSADAAERAKNEMSNLTVQQERQALINQFSKKTFKELNSTIQDTIRLCSKKIGLDIKVNYDDSELPTWIKKMSASQLKKSMAIRKQFLDTHNKGAVLKIGGQWKTYEQVANELAMMEARGTNVESKPKKTQKEIDKEKKAAEKAAKAAEKARTQAETQAGNRKKATEDYADTISSYSEKAEEDLKNRSLKAMNEGYEKEIEQIKLNDEKEKKAIEDGIDKLVEARKKKEQTIWVNSGKNRKANMWKASKTDEQYREEVLSEQMVDKDGKKLDSTIGENVKKRIQQVNEATTKSTEEAILKQSQSMYDYLKDYGTFQEQKLMIAQEYAKKIADVESSNDTEDAKKWKIQTLQQEQKKATDSVEANAIMQRIDWYQVFGNVGGIMKSSLVPLLDELKGFVGTDKFQSLGADQQKAIVDAMSNLRSQIGNTGDLGWKDLARDLVAYQEALKNAKSAQEEYSALEESLMPSIERAKKELEKSKKEGNSEGVKSAQQELDGMYAQLADSGKNVVDTNNKVKSSGQKLSQTTMNVTKPISSITDFLQNSGLSTLQEVWSAFDQLKGGIDGLKGLSDAANGAKDLSDAAEKAADGTSEVAKKVGDGFSEGLSKAGLIGQIVAAILKILDVLKDGIGTLISSLIDSILQGINGILKNLLSGKFIEQIGTSLISGIGNILDTVLGSIGSVLSFGALSSGGPSAWFKNSNAEKVAETIDRLTDRNEILTDSIDALTEEMSKNSGMRAVENAQKAEELQREKENNLKAIMEAQMGYHNSHKSFNHYWDGLTQEQIDRISKLMGRTWSGNLNDIQSADEAKIILENPDIVEAIKNTGKGGYGERVYGKLKEYADEAGNLEQITEQLNESLTQVSFDSLNDEFINTLMDMTASAKDFSSDFSKMLMQAVLKAKIDDLLGDDMQKFYDEWAAMAKANGGKLSSTNIETLRNMYDEMVKKGLDIRDEVADITGYKQSYEQSASSGAFESMSQDTGDELNGRFTAVQIATEGTYQVVQSIDQKLSQMLGLDSSSKEIVGATKEEPQPKKEKTANVDDKVTKTISDKLSKKMDDMVNDSLNFKGSTLGMIDSINKHRLLSGKHSLEYESGMSTEDLADFINSKRTDMFRTSVAELQQAGNQQVVADTQSTRGDSLLTADISSICQNVGNIYVAMDEGRTILAQSLMCLQSIDDRQESWHKPLMQAFSDLHEMKDRMQRL